MLYVTVDERANFESMFGGICQKCCCEPVRMIPGETNLMVMDYAPWSLPIAVRGPGIVPQTQFKIERDSTACDVSAIDGVLPPSNTSYTVATPLNTNANIDLAVNAAPVAGPFEYEIISTPLHGQIVGPTVNSTGAFVYQPTSGFVGYDYVYYKMTDANGRWTINSVTIAVGAPFILPPPQQQPFLGLRIIPSTVVIDQRSQSIYFPIELGIDARQCETFKVTVTQPAKDCDNMFKHISCFLVIVGKC